MLTRLGFLLFTTGFCALVYQVTWLRLLRHIFGGSTAATAAVLAIFMGGLGLGGALMARRGNALRSPLELYAKLEIGIALSAAVSPWLIGLARAVHLALVDVAPLGSWSSTIVRLVLSAVVLLVPTTLMGATLPAIAQALERADDPSRRRTAFYYGINSLGAVAGVLATTFLLLELLGIRQTLLLAAAFNLLAALTARGLARRIEGIEPSPTSSPENLAGEQPAAPQWSARVRVILVAAFCVGFVFFLMEIVWYRMLAPILGGSSFTFGLILAMALLGIACGGLLFSRRPADRPLHLGALAWTCALEGLCLVAPFLLGDRLALLAAALREWGGVQGFASLALGWAAVTALVVLPTAIVAGYQFPLLVALLGGGRERVAPEVGAAAACNTFGAIAGSLAGGFGLLPLFGAAWLWRLDVWLLAGLALALLLVGRRQMRRGAVLAVAGAATLAVAASFSAGPTGIWRLEGIGAGRFELPESPFDLKALRHSEKISTLAAEDGVESHFALVAKGDLALVNNGKSDGAAVGDAPTTIMLGLVPALLHPEPREALVIGLGTGTTAGWLADVPSIERVEVVELERIVGRLATYFEAVNRGAMGHPKIRLAYADGRAWVQTTRQHYDLIVSEPSNPYRAGVADLFSQDFYRSVAERLRPQGMLAQWLQGYDLDSEMVRMVSASLHSVFGHVEIWQLVEGDLMLVASAEPIVHDLDRVRARALQEPWSTALRKSWQVEPSAEGFYSGYLGSNTLVAALAQNSDISTDDRPYLEFGFARRVGRGGSFSPSALAKAARRLQAELPLPATGAPLDTTLVKEAQLVRLTDMEATAAEGYDEDAVLRHRARSEYHRGRPNEAARLWTNQGQPPRHPVELLLMAVSLAKSADSRAAEVAPLLATQVDAELVLALLANADGERQAAFEHLLRCWNGMRTEAFFDDGTFEKSIELGRSLVDQDRRRAQAMYDAFEAPFAAYRFELDRTLQRLQLSLQLPGDGQACVAAFAALEPHPFWSLEMLQLRHQCYLRHHHPLERQAIEDLAAAMAHAPDAFSDLSVPAGEETGK